MKKNILIILLSLVIVIFITYHLIKPNPYIEANRVPPHSSSITMKGHFYTFSNGLKDFLFYRIDTKNFIFFNFTPKIEGRLDHDNSRVIIIPKYWIWGSVEELSEPEFIKKYKNSYWL